MYRTIYHFKNKVKYHWDTNHDLQELCYLVVLFVLCPITAWLLATALTDIKSIL